MAIAMFFFLNLTLNITPFENEILLIWFYDIIKLMKKIIWKCHVLRWLIRSITRRRRLNLQRSSEWRFLMRINIVMDIKTFYKRLNARISTIHIITENYNETLCVENKLKSVNFWEDVRDIWMNLHFMKKGLWHWGKSQGAM